MARTILPVFCVLVGDDHHAESSTLATQSEHNFAAMMMPVLHPFHLAPPLISRRDPLTGEPRKRAFGPWIMTLLRLLAPLKILRGGPFGRTGERRKERQLIADYFALMDEIAGSLTPENHSITVALAGVPEKIRGFGPVKLRHMETAKSGEIRLLSEFRTGGGHPGASIQTAAE